MLEEDPQSFDRVLSSMCTEPHPAARAAAHRFLATNPGDPATYPTVAALEDRVVERLGEMAGLSVPHGYVAGGGTEANIQAVRAARNLDDVAEPNIVIPASAHFSFHKAGELLDVTVREVPVGEDYTTDPAAMVDAIDERTILVVGVAGSTEYGRVDPLADIGTIATDRGIRFHVDAAWGGFLLPFTQYEWTFDALPVDTMTVDPHKYGRAAIPAGGFLARSAETMSALRVATPYLETDEQGTLAGTRSGAGVASAAAALEELWPAGYERQYERCLANATWLAEEFSDRGLEVVDPVLPIVAADIADPTFHRLRDRGWRISRTSAGELRIVSMPHVTRPTLETLLADLDAVRAS